MQASLKDPGPPQLPLFLNTREHWGRMIAGGAARFVRQEMDWTPFICEADRLEAKVVEPAYGRPWAGLIGQFYPAHHSLLEKLCARGIPVVNVSGVPPPAGVGWVHFDDYACGAMAARHFLERGFRHYAFLGIADASFSEERQRGFLQTLGGQGSHEAIPPVSLSLRQSTDSFAVEDPLAGRALRRIRAFTGKRLTATKLAADLGVSRRTLERDMLKTLGTSVHSLIQEARLERAYKMVVESNLSIGEIAMRLGYTKQSDLNAVFKKRFARTPTSLRRGTAPENLSRKQS